MTIHEIESVLDQMYREGEIGVDTMYKILQRLINSDLQVSYIQPSSTIHYVREHPEYVEEPIEDKRSPGSHSC